MYAFDGTYLYWASGFGDANVYRMALSGGDPEVLTTVVGEGLAGIGVSGDRLDFLPTAIGAGNGPLLRMQLSTSTTESIDISSRGMLLASAGDFTYVTYSTAPPPSWE